MILFKKWKEEGSRRVSHDGERPWQATHRFEKPASADSIARVTLEIGMTLPSEIEDLWKMSDGASIFVAEDGEPWGWTLLGTERYFENQHRWRRKFFDHWRPRFLVVAELINPRSAVVQEGTQILLLHDNQGMMEERIIADNLTDLLIQIDQTDGGLWWT